MRITLSARSKILQLTKGDKPFRIQVTGSLVAGSHVDLIPNADQLPLDVTICDEPLIIADFASVNFLTHQVVDYDYNGEEFIISNRGHK